MARNTTASLQEVDNSRSVEEGRIETVINTSKLSGLNAQIRNRYRRPDFRTQCIQNVTKPRTQQSLYRAV